MNRVLDAIILIVTLPALLVSAVFAWGITTSEQRAPWFYSAAAFAVTILILLLNIYLIRKSMSMSHE